MHERFPHGPPFAQPPLCLSQQVNFMQLSFTDRPQLPPEDSGAPFTMYFTVNSAFQHFMSEFGLSDSPNPDGRLLSQEHIFDIFLNDTSKP